MVIRAISTGLFCLAFVIVLLTDGGVYPVSLAISVMVMTLCLLTAGLGRGLHPETAWLFTLVLVIWLTLVLWIVLQTLPLGLADNAAWHTLRDIGMAVPGRISAAPGDAAASLLPISLPFMTLLCALLLFRTDREVELALRVFGIAGGLFAIFAIGQLFLAPNTLMFSTKQSYGGSLTAPFVNRNTAATFYGLVTISLLASFARERKGDGRRRSSSSGSGQEDSLLPWGLLSLAVFAFMAIALTRSRAGIIFSIVGCGIMAAAIVSQLSKTKTRAGSLMGGARIGENLPIWLRRLLISAAGLFVFVVVGSMVFGRVLLRVDTTSDDGGRLCVWPGMLDIARDNGLAGIGPSAFAYYYPAYRDSACGLTGTWEKAHNVYLEAMIAFGLPVTALILAAYLAAMLVVFRRGSQKRKSRRIIVIAGIAAVLLVGLHSWTDFSVQIPGFAMVFALFLGLTSTISLNSTRNKGSGKR